MKQLWTFLGMSDRNAPSRYDRAHENPDVGPLARLLLNPKGAFDAVHIIDDAPDKGPDAESYLIWLRTLITENSVAMPDLHAHKTWPEERPPVNLHSAYSAAVKALESVACQTEDQRFYNLSSGTSSMTVVLVLLSETARFGGRALFSDPVRGLEEARIPTELKVLLHFQ